MTSTKKYVSYLRVSTKEQGIEGLGIEAQRLTIEKVISDNNGIHIQEFLEVISTKKDKRKELIKAMQLAQQEDAILIVAKLDRLGRTASNLFAIRDNVGEKLYICDKPHMSLLEFGMYATFAQEEREVISRRTKAALAARETKTGFRNGNKKGVNMWKAIEASILERKDSAMNDEKNVVASNIIRLELQKGTSLQGIADYLNAIQLKTIKGKLYTKSTVQHLIKMFDLK